MRRVLVALLAGLALVVSLAPAATAATYTFGDKTYTTDLPPTRDQLVPLPGSEASPDTELPHDNTAAYLLIGAVALAAIAGLVAWLSIRWLAIEPRWMSGGRHAFAEAGWRTASSWSEFKDWLRLGR